MGKVKARMMDMELDCDSLTDEEFFAKYLETKKDFLEEYNKYQNQEKARAKYFEARKNLMEAFNKDQNGEEVNDE